MCKCNASKPVLGDLTKISHLGRRSEVDWVRAKHVWHREFGTTPENNKKQELKSWEHTKTSFSEKFQVNKPLI